eukprot:jgi/Tetstr1/453787/TSEL_040739.t1
MRAGALRLVGADNIGRRAADFLSATLRPRSVASYSSSELNLVKELCAQADTPLVVCYISWVADRGPAQAGAFQPYPSAINTFFRDQHMMELVAVDNRATELRVPLPAEVALRRVRRPHAVLGGAECDWYVFRACLGTAANFTFLNRSQTSTSARGGDIAVASPYD